jgi:hypothetical protein
MVPRTLTWALTVGVAALAFVAGRTLAASNAPAADTVAPALVVVESGGSTRAPGATPTRVGAALQPSASRTAPLDGVELYRQVRETYPEAALHTFSAMNRIVTGAVEGYVKRYGSPAAMCGKDGSLDDVILTVRWTIATDASGAHLRGGAVAIDEFPEPVRQCLDGYLAKVEGDLPSPVPLVELDVLYQWPIPALVVFRGAAANPDAGP